MSKKDALLLGAKVLGATFTVGASLLGAWVNKKETDATIAEKVSEELAKQLKDK